MAKPALSSPAAKDLFAWQRRCLRTPPTASADPTKADAAKKKRRKNRRATSLQAKLARRRPSPWNAENSQEKSRCDGTSAFSFETSLASSSRGDETTTSAETASMVDEVIDRMGLGMRILESKLDACCPSWLLRNGEIEKEEMRYKLEMKQIAKESYSCCTDSEEEDEINDVDREIERCRMEMRRIAERGGGCGRIFANPIIHLIFDVLEEGRTVRTAVDDTSALWMWWLGRSMGCPDYN